MQIFLKSVDKLTHTISWLSN